uniref:L-type lectin-like domain-containing protein n=1 Tax=Chromera velia CCMP2878 TaxID=1169474 RepID=A0A0G4F0T1_9ALVE|mmetsp:Transcript_33831/g.67011  ORF Transcript_33831/g.67011 Transcript_33831/m.67011 type:complete len:450 (-) Transcript_33831:1253-2602(-)|eukprot:Cvel_14479.t1-p1 / transcript=Cvel_14479.t1 / gene=Cvel_14479 / organism=Chromera_velia_CCMP2878 / gene_product=Vesicular integral-membrane protein VIP36, putative / transcript_product=Vesicular integral-membrane protein VIP36, putative / location=Cvel_scaffold1032:5525-9606(-) / protein_length=449 / sequence_SO=supercontig / SO=protein_coding / is_pseudo=false
MFRLLTLCSVSALAASAASEKPRVDRFQLMDHSFNSPLNFDNTLDLWTLTQAAVPAQKHIILSPQVAERTGHFWHKQPLTTANWELNVEFEVKGPQLTKSDGFALWFSEEPFDPRDQTKETWNLYGYKRNFKGTGIFFSTFDSYKRLNPQVSMAQNNGVSAYPSNLSSTGTSFDWRNRGTMIFRMATGPNGMIGQIKAANDVRWTEVFHVKERVKGDVFVGFSAYTGPEAGSPGKKADAVMIKGLSVFNLDMRKAGEANSQTDTEDVKKARELLEHATKNHAEQIEQVRQLTTLLSHHVEQLAPREREQLAQLAKLSQRVRDLSGRVSTLSKEVSGHMQASNGGKGSAMLEQMKFEMDGMRAHFNHHNENHKQTVQRIASSLKTKSGSAGAAAEGQVRALKQHAAIMERTIRRQHSYSQMLFLLVLVIVASFAVFMWRRVHQLEKKHLF